MRLAPTLLAAAVAAVAVAHEWHGDNDWELEDGERKGHSLGQPAGDRGHRFKETSWWEKLQGKGPAEYKHSHMHPVRDAMIPEAVATVRDDDGDETHPMHHHHHSGKKHHHEHHEHHHHKGEHHHHKDEHHHRDAHAGSHRGKHGYKGHEKGKPWDKWDWFSGSVHEPILPREAREPFDGAEGFPEHEHHKDHKHAYERRHGEHHPEHQHKGEHSGAHKGGYGDAVWGEHPQNEHGHFHEGIGHHRPEGLASPHFARDVDTNELGPDNDVFYDDDFNYGDEDDTPDVYSRAVNDAEETADPNEMSGDEAYYEFGDDGDDDILAGHLTDSPDDNDDDQDLSEADLDYDDEDDEGDDNDDADEGTEDDDSESIQNLKRWVEVKKHGKPHKHPEPVPKKGWGLFPW